MFTFLTSQCCLLEILPTKNFDFEGSSWYIVKVEELLVSK